METLQQNKHYYLASGFNYIMLSVHNMHYEATKNGNYGEFSHHMRAWYDQRKLRQASTYGQTG